MFFTLRGKARSDNSDQVVFALRINDNSETSSYLADCNKPVLEGGMSFVEDLQVVFTFLE